MNLKSALKSVIISTDFVISALIVIGLTFIVPSRVPLSVAKEIFSISVAVLSIVFSVFFAALAIIITAGDNDFIDFLESDGSYTHIVWTFKFTLLILFISLIVAIVLYVTILPYVDSSAQSSTPLYYPRWIVLIFAFVAMWALFAAAAASLDAIKYAEYRARYIKIMSMSKDEMQDSDHQ